VPWSKLQKMTGSITLSTQLLPKTKRYLLAVSGGKDSMVLWHLLWQHGYDVCIAHVNYNLRGEDSLLDEQLVAETAKSRQQQLFIKSVNTKEAMQGSGQGLQEFARHQRYKFFEDICHEQKIDFIVTAHHADDNIETILMRLGRGTGIQGLLGIAVKNEKILRPLLHYTAEEITNYAQEHKITWREDVSNASNDYLRNEIRNLVIPAWRHAQPDFIKNMQANIARWQDVAAVYHVQLAKLKRQCFFEEANNTYRISISGLKKTGFAELLLFEILSGFEASAKQAQEAIKLLEAEHGAILELPRHNIIKVQQDLMITPLHTASVCIIEKDTKHIAFQLGKIIQEADAKTISASSDEACLCMSKLNYPLTLRTIKAGDYFYPLGLGKKKKLSKFLIDKKIPLHKKQNVWVLCSGPHIVWVVGHRIDERFKAQEAEAMIKLILVPHE
jgi:tRNA(Ile)-lysidine synthase